MGLSGKVHDGIDVFSDEKVVNEVITSDISFNEPEVWRRKRRIEVLQI